jgi:hypothetical protein
MIRASFDDESTDMKSSHMVIWLDHERARILRFGPTGIQAHQVLAPAPRTASSQGRVRALHAFFGEICESSRDVADWLVTGPHAALWDFRHFVADHRPADVDLIFGYQAFDHPSDRQLIDLARRRFCAIAPATGIPGAAFAGDVRRDAARR